MSPEELKQARQSLGWTQPAAAEHLGVTLRTYKYYEAGETSRGTKTAQVPKSIALAMTAYRFARDIATIVGDEER